MSPFVVNGKITLFQLDTTELGGDVLYFTSAADFEEDIFWGGERYVAIPMDAVGFEYNTTGTIPQPTVTISNLFGAANNLLGAYRGLIGAQLVRIVTLTKYLDNGETPDPTAYISSDTFVIAQKMSQNAAAIAFKLASKIDQEGIKIPKRLILRDVCSRTYRVWDEEGQAFNYSKATCPYSGSLYYNENDQPVVDPASDVCSRTMTGCVDRFGSLPLPGYFFPGVGKVK
jgi:lambda family phage minor tail protein L